MTLLLLARMAVLLLRPLPGLRAYCYQYLTPNNDKRISLPSECNSFVMDFDNKVKVEPFSFELDL